MTNLAAGNRRRLLRHTFLPPVSGVLSVCGAAWESLPLSRPLPGPQTRATVTVVQWQRPSWLLAAVTGSLLHIAISGVW